MPEPVKPKAKGPASGFATSSPPVEAAANAAESAAVINAVPELAALGPLFKSSVPVRAPSRSRRTEPRTEAMTQWTSQHCWGSNAAYIAPHWHRTLRCITRHRLFSAHAVQLVLRRVKPKVHTFALLSPPLPPEGPIPCSMVADESYCSRVFS